MCKVFHGNSKNMHDAFQTWRRKSPDGFHMTEGAAGQFTIHYTEDRRENEERHTQDQRENAVRGCHHQGGSGNKYHEDKDCCYTTAKKVCSNDLAELIAWANDRGFTTKNCKHCDTKRFPFPAIPNDEARLTGQEGDVFTPDGK